MAQWIEVKVRYDKMTDSGKTVKVTDPYLVDALTCTEAEARNINAGTTVIIPAQRTVKFKVSKQLKDSLNNGSKL